MAGTPIRAVVRRRAYTCPPACGRRARLPRGIGPGSGSHIAGQAGAEPAAGGAKVLPRRGEEVLPPRRLPSSTPRRCAPGGPAGTRCSRSCTATSSRAARPPTCSATRVGRGWPLRRCPQMSTRQSGHCCASSTSTALVRGRDGRGGQAVPPRQRLPAPARAAGRIGPDHSSRRHTDQGGCRLITTGPPPKFHGTQDIPRLLGELRMSS